MCRALVLVHGLTNELHLCVERAGFGPWIKERVICVARLLRFMD